MVSPKSFKELLLLSVTDAVFVTSIKGTEEIVTWVGSFVVLPSVSSPSSLTSLTSLVFPGLLAVAKTELLMVPVSAEFWEIIYVAKYVSFSPTTRVPWAELEVEEE